MCESRVQAWLGYYNGALKRIGWKKEDLVAAANAMVLNAWGAKEVCVFLLCYQCSCHVRP